MEEIDWQEELQKCKDDFIYWLETYVRPEIKLREYQKEWIRRNYPSNKKR